MNDAVSSKTSREGDTVSFTVAENVMDGNVLLVPAGTVGSGTDYIFEKARSFGRNGALDITFDTIPAIDGTEFTAVQGKEAKDKTRSEVKSSWCFCSWYQFYSVLLVLLVVHSLREKYRVSCWLYCVCTTAKIP